MARMIPSDPPVTGDASKLEPWVRRSNQSERAAFDALKTGLSDEYTVYWGLHFVSPSTHKLGEFDFLICHARDGLLFLECKGHGIGRASDGYWYRTMHDGSRRRTGDPVQQVQSQMRAMVEIFQRRIYEWRNTLGFTDFPLTYGYGLIFPFTRNAEVLTSAALNESLVLDRDEMGSIADGVKRAMRFWRQAHPRPAMIRRKYEIFLDRVVFPSFEVTSDIGDRITSEAQAFQRLDAQQRVATHAILGSPRIAVAGSAGTGKTVVGLRAARRAAQAGERVLLLTFNRQLAIYLEERLKDAIDDEDSGTIDVRHYHRLCAEAAEEAGIVLDFPTAETPKSEQTKFWDQTCPRALMDAINQGAVQSYDRIIVDEYQDFDGAWLDSLEALLDGANPGASIALLYDPAQTLFRETFEIPSHYARIPLIYNYRNSRAIAEYLQSLHERSAPPHPDLPTGEAPEVHGHANARETSREVGDLLKTLVQTEGVSPGQIVILSPHRPKSSSLGERDRLNGVPLTRDVSERDEAVLHTTFGAFKGLEADVVIMIDVDDNDPRSNAAAQYVAASRARHRLYVWQA